MPTPVSTYEQFRADVIELATLLVHTAVVGDKDLVPMLHARFPSGATTGWPIQNIDDRNVAARMMAGLVREYEPIVVALTFSAWTGARVVEPRHEAAVACVIDREVTEIHEARLVRHDGRASLGAWRKWALDEFTAPLITPIEEAMR